MSNKSNVKPNRPAGGQNRPHDNKQGNRSMSDYNNGQLDKRGSFGMRGGDLPGGDMYAGPSRMYPQPMMYPPGPMGMMPSPMMHPMMAGGSMPMPGSGSIMPFMSGGPTYDLPVKEKEDEKKFTGRCRLFVAGIPPNIKEDDIKGLFEQYGEVSEVFLGSQNSFAFVKMDTRTHAQEARDNLDSKMYEGRILRVRLAAHAAAVRVKNISQVVTNELLEYAFSYFGEVERAVVITDDRGRSVGEGIVEFARKTSAQLCLRRCQQECFLLTANPAPVIVEPCEQRDEDEGFGEKHLNRNSVEFKIEREVGPRFADPQSFEYDFGSKFKQLYEIEREKRARLETEIDDARRALMEQMEYSRVEYQTKMLKEKLKQMEEKANAFKGIRSPEEEKARQEARVKEEQLLRQKEEEILRRSQFGDFRQRQEEENAAVLGGLPPHAMAGDMRDMPPPFLPHPSSGGYGPSEMLDNPMGNPYPSYEPEYGLDGPPMEIGARYGPDAGRSFPGEYTYGGASGGASSRPQIGKPNTGKNGNAPASFNRDNSFGSGSQGKRRRF